MISDYTKIQILISCPGDLEPEKRRLEKVCEKINLILEEAGCNVFVRINDFKNIVAPIGKRPQSVVNVTYANYDFYFGVLYMRFGTPTGELDPDTGLEYPSGTFEEFKIAHRRRSEEKGGPAVYFFFKEPSEVVDEGGIEQLGKVKQFRKDLGSVNWVNSFKETIEFGDLADRILMEFLLKFCSEKLVSLKAASLAQVSDGHAKLSDISQLSLEIDTALAQHYVTRTVTSLKNTQPRSGNWIDRLWQVKEEETLSQALFTNKRIVLLGNAGTGKSTELAKLVQDCRDSVLPYVAVYKRFNSYVDQAIEEFLPKGWLEIDSDICMVVLDGLDEVQPHFFNTAIRNIQSFALNYPKVHIIISSRTNFYSLPEKGSKHGLLNGFAIYFLDDFSKENVEDFAQQHDIEKPERFIRVIMSQGFGDLIGKPFFLDVLIEAYKENPKLELNRRQLFEHILQSRIQQDESHFKTTIPLGKRRQTLIRTIERIALVMESMGTNIISIDQLRESLTEDHLALLEYFPAFGKVKNNDHQWGFEHNNIQEYLAARVLSGQPIEKIKQLVSTGKDKTRLKQSWLNTLSFLVSLGDEKLVSDLIAWLRDFEPEALVRFEAARVPADIRKKIFYSLYNVAKKRGIWIRSNKYSEEELARFGESEETFDFLISELETQDNLPITRMNALRLLRNFHLSDDQKQELKEALLSLVDNHPKEYNLLHTLLYVVKDHLSGDLEMVKALMRKLGHYTNQYVRAGMYAVLMESPFINEYVDYLIGGVTVSQKDTNGQRESVNLADESWNLQRAFKNITEAPALKKILAFFTMPYDRRHVNYYDRPEVLTEVINNAVDAFFQDPTVYDAVLKLFLFHGRHSTRGNLLQIRPFFDQTHTRAKAFADLWKMDMPNEGQYEKRIALLNVASKETIDHIIEQYKIKKISDEDIKGLYNDLDYYRLETEEDRQLVQHFRERIENETTIDISRPAVIDYQGIQKTRNQQSFDLLFEKSKFVVELRRLYQEMGKDSIEFNDLWEFSRNNHSADAEDYFARCVLDVLRDWTRDNNHITLEEAEALIEIDFEYFSMHEAYDHLKHYDGIEVSQAQQDHIERWCDKTMESVPVEKLVTVIHEHSFSINNHATHVWFFLHKLGISLRKDVLLNFTLFVDVDKRDNSDDEFAVLQRFTDKAELEQRVIQNLSQPIAFSLAWRNNAVYAIQSGLIQAYTGIKEGIQSTGKEINDRLHVLGMYYEKTGDNELLRTILESGNVDEVFWLVRELWIKHQQDQTILTIAMLRIMRSTSIMNEYVIKAAEQLIALGNDEAFYFYTDLVLNGMVLTEDRPSRLTAITGVTKIEYLPRLMELLLLSKQPESLGAFRSFDHMIISALKSVALQSESNMQKVTLDMRQFITDHPEIQHIQFMHHQIEDIETAFSLQESQNYTLADILGKVNMIRPE